MLGHNHDQICTTGLHIHGKISWFSNSFQVCLRSVPEIWYICPAIVAAAVITYKIIDVRIKHLPPTDGHLKGFLDLCGLEIQSSNHLHLLSLWSLCQRSKMYY